MAAVLQIENHIKVQRCGGSVLASTVILTSAFCVHEIKNVDILRTRAGEWDTQSENEILPHQERQVEAKQIHPEFDNRSLANNIALFVQPICLPPAGMKFDHSRCYATGWGKNEFGKDGKYQVILKKIDLPIVPREQCQANLRSTRLGRHFQLDKSFICAGGELGKDTCKGDGGLSGGQQFRSILSSEHCILRSQLWRIYESGSLCGRCSIDDGLKMWNIDSAHYTA